MFLASEIKAKPHSQKKLRESLNNSDINNFASGSQEDSNLRNGAARKLTDKTMQQTPNLEKRDLEGCNRSVSSEEEKQDDQVNN